MVKIIQTLKLPVCTSTVLFRHEVVVGNAALLLELAKGDSNFKLRSLCPRGESME